ncbi:MAG: hypothetical protein WDZ76_03325 [Pseudohongiellaceae bacterium]
MIQEDDFTNIFYRRRILAAVVLLSFFIGGAMVSDGDFLPLAWWQDNSRGEFVTGDAFGEEWVYAYCTGNEQQITVLQNGQLAGADALSSLSIDAPDGCDQPRVDNPDLNLWQTQLQSLNSVTRGDHQSAVAVLNEAMSLPLSSLYLRPVSEWLQREPQNATAFLDAITEIRPNPRYGTSARNRTGRDNLSSLVIEALVQIDTSSVSAGQLERWLDSEWVSENGDAVVMLAGMNNVDERIKAGILSKLDRVPEAERSRLFLSLAEDLVADELHARLLARQISDLPRSSRLGAAQRLLAQPDSSTGFANELLLDLDRIFYGETVELDVFTAVAEKIKSEPDAPRVLTAALEQLKDLERRIAAIYLLRLDDSDNYEFTLGVLEEFDELHEISQPLVVEAIVRSPQFRHLDVQRACLDTIEREMSGRSRSDALAEMLRRQALDETLKPRILAMTS